MKNKVKQFFFCWPFTKWNMHVLCAHMRRISYFSKGLESMSGPHVSQEKGAHAFCSASDRSAQSWVKKLKAEALCGVLFDGSKDISKVEQEIVYIVSLSSSREFSSDFLGFIHLGDNRGRRLCKLTELLWMWEVTSPNYIRLWPSGISLCRYCIPSTPWKTAPNQLITWFHTVQHSAG